MVAGEPDYEKLIAEPEGDLQMVHTVPLAQVRRVVERWMPAITKEVKNPFAGTLTKITFDEAKQMERQGLVKILPSKGVFTIKPPSERGDVLRRKFCLVICGNFAPKPGEDEAMSLYAGGASAETLRIALVFASRMGWTGATSDVTGVAKYAVHPPRLLIETGHAQEGEAWLVQRPLYGIREAPAIWAKFRSERMSGAKIPFGGDFIILQPSLVDPELWLVYNVDGETQEKGNLIGLIITYVDDLFYLSTPEVIETLHKWVEAEWPCSALEWANSEDGTRYLGLTVKQDSDGSFVISQEGYILDLVRSYSMENAIGAKLPCPKEWLVEEELNPDNDENFSEEELKSAQRIVGEQLWLAMRTRSDIL